MYKPFCNGCTPASKNIYFNSILSMHCRVMVPCYILFKWPSLYNCCPCVSVTWRLWRFVHPRQVILPSGEWFVHPRQVILPSGFARGQYYLSRVNKSSCYPHTRATICPRAILPVEGEQIVMLPSHKGNNCFIMPINIFVCNVKKNMNTDQRCVLISFAVKLLRV